MRNLVLLLLLVGWLPAIEVTVIADFATDEDTALVFDVDDLAALCTVSSGTLTGFRITDVSNGTIATTTAPGDPWNEAPTLPITLNGTGLVRYLPTENLCQMDKSMLVVRAMDGAVIGDLEIVNIDIAPVNDPITAHSGEFDQATATIKVTEDITYDFTWQQLIDTLGVVEIDNQGWGIVLTDRLVGDFWDADGVPITSDDVAIGPVPADRSQKALSWRSPLNLYTRSDEDPLELFRLRVINTDGDIDQTAILGFTSRIENNPDLLNADDPTTLTSVDPLPFDLADPKLVTYDDIHSRMHGCTDIDRNGQMDIRLNASGMAGTKVELFIGGTYVETRTIPDSSPLYFLPGWTLRITPPIGTTVGLHPIGTMSISVSDSDYYSPAQALIVDVIDSTGGGTDGGGGGGGGGACGAGGTVAGLLCGCLFLRFRRRPVP